MLGFETKGLLIRKNVFLESLVTEDNFYCKVE